MGISAHATNTSANHLHTIRVQRSIVSADALAPIIAQAYALERVGCQLIKQAGLQPLTDRLVRVVCCARSDSTRLKKNRC